MKVNLFHAFLFLSISFFGCNINGRLRKSSKDDTVGQSYCYNKEEILFITTQPISKYKNKVLVKFYFNSDSTEYISIYARRKRGIYFKDIDIEKMGIMELFNLRVDSVNSERRTW